MSCGVLQGSVLGSAVCFTRSVLPIGQIIGRYTVLIFMLMIFNCIAYLNLIVIAHLKCMFGCQQDKTHYHRVRSSGEKSLVTHYCPLRNKRVQWGSAGSSSYKLHVFETSYASYRVFDAMEATDFTVHPPENTWNISDRWLDGQVKETLNSENSLQPFIIASYYWTNNSMLQYMLLPRFHIKK